MSDAVPAGPLKVGDRAPDFELRDQNNQLVSLSSLRADRNVLVVFYPLAFTGTCQGELGYIRDQQPQFFNDDVTTVTISVGPSPTHKVWASAQGFLFPLLSDFWPHGEVAKKYGVFNEQAGLALRGTFLIDTEGIVRFAEVNQPGEPRNQEAWKKAVADLV